MSQAPKLVIDTKSTIPVYRQVVDNLRSLLVEGALKPGMTLPTVRDLGLELGVHFNTIAEAYRLLASEGWLDLRRGRGAVVTERIAPKPSHDALANFSRSLRQLIAQVRSDGVAVHSIAKELDRIHRELSL